MLGTRVHAAGCCMYSHLFAPVGGCLTSKARQQHGRISHKANCPANSPPSLKKLHPQVSNGHPMRAPCLHCITWENTKKPSELQIRPFLNAYILLVCKGRVKRTNLRLCKIYPSGSTSRGQSAAILSVFRLMVKYHRRRRGIFSPPVLFLTFL